MSSSFFFIPEAQQGGYSKSALSAINAHVARYSHQQRRLLLRAHSAPDTPEVLGECECEQREGIDYNNDNELSRNVRRASAPSLPNTKHRRAPKNMKFYSPQLKSASPRLGELASRVRSSKSDALTFSEAIENEDTLIAETMNFMYYQICRAPDTVGWEPYTNTLGKTEKGLFHFWCTELLRTDFGMAYSPDTFQSQLIQYKSFPVPLAWTVYRAAEDLRKRDVQSTVGAYHYKQKAIKRLQEILADPDTSTDEAIASITQSVIHNTEFRRVHLQGMDALIVARGGLKKVLRSCAVTRSDHVALMYTFAPCEIVQHSELETLTSCVFDTLMEMQDQSNDFQLMVLDVENWANSTDLADMNRDRKNMDKWAYVELWKRVFSPNTAIGSLVRREYHRDILGTEADYQLKSRPFAALFQLNATLLELGTMANRKVFLQYLVHAVAKCATTCHVTGRPKIMAGTFMFTLGHACRQIQQELGFGTEDEFGAQVAIKVIAAVKLFDLMLESMRDKLYTYLQYWILGPAMFNPATSSNPLSKGLSTPKTDPDRKLHELTKTDLQATAVMIEQLWMLKQRSRSSTPEDENVRYASHSQRK